jgi:hypothetical protein
MVDIQSFTPTPPATQYVPIKAICEELTSYGFSYKFGGSSPIIQPWKLSEGKARKVGLLFEGENAIRKFWEEHVRPKLSDEFYTYVSPVFVFSAQQIGRKG